MLVGSFAYDVPLIPQPNTTSCWAASMAMLVSHRDSAMVSPQQIADPAGMNLNSSYGWDILRRAIRHWGLREYPATPALSEFAGLLRNNGPLWLVVTGAPTHAVVLTGSDGTLFSWNDPWPPGVGRQAVMQTSQTLANRFGGASSLVGGNFQILMG